MNIYLAKSSNGTIVLCHDEELDWYKFYANICNGGIHSEIDLIAVDGVDLYEEN
jgi:hypothetical protein